MDFGNWEGIAENCTEWKRDVVGGFETSEVQNLVDAELKQSLQKGIVSWVH